MQRCRLIITLLFLTLTVTSVRATELENLEDSVCGPIREPFAFWMWSSAADEPNPEAANRIANAEPIAHRTKDGRVLRGYKLNTIHPGGKIVGSVLVAQGNGMLADQLLSSLTSFSKTGVEVYIFDYRGYGNSEGKPRLKAIVNDYKEIFDSIGASTQGKQFLYGISFGGVVLLNVVGSGISFDRAVIDSTPSRVSNLGCPKAYDPVVNFPKDGSKFLIMAGALDEVVPLKDSQELVDLARARGGRIEVRRDFAHPYMDSNIRVHLLRIALIRSFLAASDSQEAR